MLPDKLSVLQYRRVHIRYYSAGKTGIEHIFLQNKIIKHYRKVGSIPTTTMRKKLHEWKICSLLMDGVCVFTGFRCDVMQWISSMCVRWNNRPEICVFFISLDTVSLGLVSVYHHEWRCSILSLSANVTLGWLIVKSVRLKKKVSPSNNSSSN